MNLKKFSTWIDIVSWVGLAGLIWFLNTSHDDLSLTELIIYSTCLMVLGFATFVEGIWVWKKILFGKRPTCPIFSWTFPVVGLMFIVAAIAMWVHHYPG